MSTRNLLAVLLAVVLTSAGQVQAQGNPFNPYAGPAMTQQAQWSYGAATGGSVMPGYNPYMTTMPGSVYPYGGGTSPYNPYSPYTPYSPYGGYGYNPYTSDLFGYASILNAYGQLTTSYGQYTNQIEQARILRESAMQAKLDTIKKKFELQLYIKANTPTFTQEQAKIASQRLKRIQTNSTPAEISNGTALNLLLDDIRRQPDKSVAVNPPVGEDVLKQINVIKNSGNLGLLRDDGKFTWPVAFLDVLTPDEQKKIELTARSLVQKAFKDQPDPNLLKELRNLLTSARENLATKVNDIPSAQYLDAKRFLNDFDEARLALERNEAQAFLEYRKFIANGKSVQEVVRYMVDKGLKLAPATAQDEAAYRALYSAMVAFDVALNAGAVAAADPKE